MRCWEEFEGRRWVMDSTGFRRQCLYYPFFRVRNDRWLKASALYWPRIAQLVPKDYPENRNGGSTEYKLRYAKPGVLYRISPGDAVTSVGKQFLEVLRDYGDELEQLMGVRRFFSNPERYGRIYGGPDEALAGIHATHVIHNLRDALIEKGLAILVPSGDGLSTRDVGVLRALFDHRRGLNEVAESLPIAVDPDRLMRELHRGRGSQLVPDEVLISAWAGAVTDRGWIGAHEKLVAVYNSVLVEAVAMANQLQPTTDQADAFAVINNWTSDRIAAALIGNATSATGAVPRRLARPDVRQRFLAGDQAGRRPLRKEQLAQTIALLAIDMVVPANLGEVDADKILEIRQRYGAEFRAFGLAVDQAAADLAELADITDQSTLERYLQDEVTSRFAQPTEDLRRQLKGLKLDAATMTVNVKTHLPATAALVGGATLTGHPAIAGTGAVAIGLLTIRRGIRQQRDTALQAAPAASFLLHTREHLGAHNAARQAIRGFQRIAGTDSG